MEVFDEIRQYVKKQIKSGYDGHRNIIEKFKKYSKKEMKYIKSRSALEMKNADGLLIIMNSYLPITVSIMVLVVAVANEINSSIEILCYAIFILAAYFLCFVARKNKIDIYQTILNAIEEIENKSR